MTAAVQTGLSCSAPLLVRVLRPLPRRDPTLPPNPERRMLPSPRHDRLGSRIVTLSRLQASLHVAARVLAPRCSALAAWRAFDAPLGREGLPSSPGACYPALRRLPGRDLHPLETCSVRHRASSLLGLCLPLRHDAPWRAVYPGVDSGNRESPLRPAPPASRSSLSAMARALIDPL